MNIFIIIPVFNEQLAIKNVLTQLIAHGYQQIIVVDDGSTQNIYEAIAPLKVYYIRHAFNLGQGAALQTGMDAALALGADIVVHFDGDGQHAVADIPRLTAPLISGQFDLTLGSRFIRKEDSRLVPPRRRLLLAMARIFNLMLTGVLLTDAHNGLRSLNVKAMKTIRIKENKMAHATEIIAQMIRRKLGYQEVHVTVQYTDYSMGKVQRFFSSFNILADLLISKILR